MTGARATPTAEVLRRARTVTVAAMALGLVAVACSSEPAVVVRTPTAPVTPASTAPVSTTPASTTRSARPRPVHPTVRITPASGLRDQQAVRVSATGFTPGEALTVIQCASQGANTGPGDCNLNAMTPVTADATGAVTVKLPVVRGPFGANKVSCTRKQPCLVSVTQASLSPTEEADATIAFAHG